jgi:hypothetical protein
MEKSPFQFSLRMMLAAVAVVGIGAALWVAEPSWQVGAIELTFSGWVLASAVLLSINSKTNAKAWWVGVLVHCVMSVFIYCITLYPTFLENANDPIIRPVVSLAPIKWVSLTFSTYIRSLLVGFATAPVLGIICVLTHWLFIRPKG